MYLVCPRCKSDNIFTDFENKTYRCRTCGLVWSQSQPTTWRYAMLCLTTLLLAACTPTRDPAGPVVTYLHQRGYQPTIIYHQNPNNLTIPGGCDYDQVYVVAHGVKDNMELVVSACCTRDGKKCAFLREQVIE